MPSLILFNKPYGILSQFTGGCDSEQVCDTLDLRLVNGAKSMFAAQRLALGVAAVAFPGRTADKRRIQKFQMRGAAPFRSGG